jgi:predicted nucleic acid-binding protein
MPPAYLVDTNVLSNAASAERDANVAEWLFSFASLIRISVITIAEMRRGLVLIEQRIAKASTRNVRERERRRLSARQAWYANVVQRFSDKIEVIDVSVAERWAEISVRFPSLRDGDKAIAATALARGFGVATRNIGDFRAIGMPLVNPFEPATWDERLDDDPIRRL